MDYNLQNEKVTTDPNGNVISSASLSPAPTIQPVTPTPDTTDYSGITGGVTQSVINDYKTLNDQQKAAQTAQTGAGTDILTLMGQLSGKTADMQAANTAAGVDTETANLNKYAQQLADLNAQASSLNREAQAVPIQVQQNNQGTGATDVGVAPQQAGALRLNALKALSIGQQSDVAAYNLSGSQIRLQAAKEKAQSIVDLTYVPLEKKLEILQQQYSLNKDSLDAIDKKRSEALQISLQKEAQDLAEKKATAKVNTGLALTAGVNTQFVNQNGKFFDARTGDEFATPADFFKAAGVTSFEDAYQKGLVTDLNNSKLQEINSVQQMNAKYPTAGILSTDSIDIAKAKLAKDPVFKKDTYIAPNAYSGSNGQGSSSYIAIDSASIKDPNASNNDWGGLSLNGLTNAAKLYLANSGKMPALGLGSSKATQQKRDAIINFAGQLADAAGMDVTQISAMYKANSKAASDIINRVAKVEATSGALTSQFPRLADLAGKVGNIGITESDLTAGKAKIQSKFGSVDASNYAELIQTVRGDYTAMQAALGGGRGGEFFAKNAQEAIPLGLTPDQYLGLMDTIQQSAQVSANATQAEAQKLVSGQNYSSANSSGEITVKLKSTGQIGTIPASEFDSNIYEKQ